MQLSELNITPKKEKQLNSKGIYSGEDLVRFVPRKYNDYSVITGIIPEMNESSSVIMIKSVQLYNKTMPVVVATCSDYYTNARVNVSWFNQPYMRSKVSYMIGQKVYIVGKFMYNEQYNNYSVANPSVFTDNIKEGLKIYPVYSKISGMSEEYLQSKMQVALLNEDVKKETIPEHFIEQFNLFSTRKMLHELHFPDNMENLKKAQERLIFDDLLYFSLRLEYAARRTAIGSPFGIKTLKTVNNVIQNLGFELTKDQKDTLNDMISRIKDGRRLNVLLQGDVGVGKTIVAFLIMLAMYDSGYQSVLMAPTQVLAEQHYNDLVKLVEPYGVRVALLAGNAMSKRDRTAMLGEIEMGKINIVVGTHAVLNKDIRYKNLALTITDEEHKFGVLQRKALMDKALSGVHSITMSATPIPRSLAQVLYGNEIQMYTIKTKPNGRLPIKTAVNNSYKGTQKFLYEQLKQGRQAYVVCPMIDKNEDMEGVKSVEEIKEIYSEVFEKRGFKVEALTGRNSKEEVSDIISRFKSGDISILVATTVVEVGVNVPNASVIIIHNAERFGLSGLHQLRGRVGRGKHQSYCVLFSDDKENERLKVMCSTTDGFKIAEEDLRLRGAGDFIGTKQSGDDKYISLMLSYPDLYKESRKVASELLDTEEECIILHKLFNDITQDTLS